MNAIVIYTSKYGSTEKYANWIAEALDCPAKKLQEVGIQEMNEYDVIIYGGGLYAGRVAGLKKFLSQLGSAEDKRLVLFILGMTNPTETKVYTDAAEQNLPQEWRDCFEVFSLRGDQLFSKMSRMHKLMMRMPKSVAEKKPMAERTEDDKHFLEHYGRDVIFANREQIKPILDRLADNDE